MIIIYAISGFLLIKSYLEIIKASNLGWAIALSDFLFIAGVGIYPILYLLGIISPGLEGEAYISQNGPPGFLAAMHVLGIALGAKVATSYSLNKPEIQVKLRKYHGVANAISTKTNFWLAITIACSVLYLVFFYKVGLYVALSNVAAARSGEFDGFGDDKKYLFLKTAAAIGLFSCVIIPGLRNEKKTKSRIFFFFYATLLILSFLNSISRAMFLNFLIAPLLLYYLDGIRERKVRVMEYAGLVFSLAIGLGIALFGKSIGTYLYLAYSTTGEGVTGFTLEVFNEGANPLETILRNSEFMWYSISGGIKVFFESSDWPFIEKDIYLAPIGFIPSTFFSLLDLESLDYRSAERSLACINSTQFGFSNCTVPPNWSGYSAYFLPVFGGFFLTAFKFHIYGRLAKYWSAARINYSKSRWIYYLIFLMMSNFFMMIPSAMSISSFFVVIIISATMAKYLLMRVNRN
jgi:hypothetical protein